VLNIWPVRRGALDTEFTVASADAGYRFHVQAHGKWRRIGGHQAPADAAACHLVDLVAPLAAACPILAPTELEHRVNRSLGRPAADDGSGVRLLWVTVHVHVDPQDLHDATVALRDRAAARGRLREQRLRLEQAVAVRDLLREDPTLAAAMMLAESPAYVGEHTVALVQQLAELVAAYSPGSTWVATARLLEAAFGALPAEARTYAVDSMCTALAEFSATIEAGAELRRAHGSASAPEVGDLRDVG